MKINIAISDYLKNSLICKTKAYYSFELSHLKTLSKYFLDYNINYLDEINLDFIHNFILDCRKKENTNKTINKRIMLIKNLLKFYKINNEEVLTFKKLPEQNKRFNMFKMNDLKTILNYFYNLNTGNNKADFTDKTIIFLFLDTGIRVNELLNIDPKNIDFVKNKVLLETTKSGISREVPFTKFTANYLRRIVKLNRNKNCLFWNYRSNKQVNYWYIKNFFDNAKKELNLDKFHPHMFRHTTATLLVEKDCPLEIIQQILGHASIKTTEIYLHLSIKRTLLSYNKFYPELELYGSLNEKII